MRAFLEAEISTFNRHGIDRFAFYSVPSMQGANAAYARRFCAAFSDSTCIVGEDPRLLAGLQRDMDGFGFDHLHGAGRRLYTLWLGDRLLASDVRPWTSSRSSSSAFSKPATSCIVCFLKRA